MIMAASCPCRLRTFVLVSALSALYISSIFIIIGLTTNFWLELRRRDIHNDDVEAHFGLHRVCYASSDRCTNPNTNYDEKDSLPAIRGLVCTGAFFAVIATGFAMAIFAYDRLGEAKLKLTIAAAIICGLTGLFLIIGCILFSIKVNIDPELILFPDNIYKGYSFGLTVTAGGLSCISGLLYVWACFLKSEEVFLK